MVDIRRFLPPSDPRYLVLSNPEVQEFIQIISPHKIGKEQLWFLDAMDYAVAIAMGYMNTSVEALSIANSKLYIGEALPIGTVPLHGDRWLHSSGAFLTYVNDGDSEQWVELGPGSTAVSIDGGTY